MVAAADAVLPFWATACNASYQDNARYCCYVMVGYLAFAFLIEPGQTARCLLPCCRVSDDVEGDLECQPSQCIRSALSQCWGTPRGQPLPHAGLQKTEQGQTQHTAYSVHARSHSHIAETQSQHMFGSHDSLNFSPAVASTTQSGSHGTSQLVQHSEAHQSSQQAANQSTQQYVDQQDADVLSQQSTRQSSLQDSGQHSCDLRLCRQQRMDPASRQGASQQSQISSFSQQHIGGSQEHSTQSSKPHSHCDSDRQELEHSPHSGSHAHRAGFASLQEEPDFEGLSVCSENSLAADRVSSGDPGRSQPCFNGAVFERIR